MKKLFFLLTALFMCLTFCGCADVKADFGIDESFNAYMKYHIKMDFSNIDPEYTQSIKETLSSVCKYYEHTLGFTTQQNIFDDKQTAEVDLICTKECTSYTNAFNELKGMLSDPKMTPFISLETGCDTAEYEQAFSFSAETDFAKIIATSGYERFSKDLKEMISSSLDSTSGTFSITLPATTIVESIVETQTNGLLCTQTIPLSLKEPMKLKLVTRLSRENKQPAAISTEESIKQIKSDITLYTGIAIALGVLAVIGLVIFIVVLKKSKSALCVTADTFTTDDRGDI